jgi:hypothetical protein
MKSLYKYIHESLLDDEDEIFDRAEEVVVRDMIAKIDKLVLKRSIWGGECTKFIENTLLINHSNVRVDSELLEALLDLHKVKPFDTISVAHTLEILEEELLNGKTIETIRASNVILGHKVNNVSNMVFDLAEQPLGLNKPRFISVALGKGLTMTNVEIYMYGETRIDKALFSNIPVLRNVKFEKVLEVQIYNPQLFEKVIVLDGFNKFFDTKYLYKVTTSADKTISRKGDVKTIVATVNNPIKYTQDNMVGMPYSINSNAKLSDIFDNTSFSDELNRITFANNNVEFEFYRDDAQRLKFPKKNKFGPTDLPNDKGWHLEICKK